MTPDMTFRTRLATARKAKHLSQTALAERVGAAQSTVASYEREGSNEPPLAMIERLAKELEITPEWLAFAVGEEAVSNKLALVPELDMRVTAGHGGLIEVAKNDGEAVLRRYGFPKEDFRGLFGSKPDGVVIIEVVGDSMAPTLIPGERVIVNTNDRSASPPGIFVVWDGLGLVLKRVEFVAHSDPPRVRIMSDNSRYDAYERELGEAQIQGRVIGSLQRR
jgi:transcriptional regulator with XRE-family HTH domain